MSFPLAFAALLLCSESRSLNRSPTGCGSRPQRETRVAWLVEKHDCLADAKSMRLSKLKTILVHHGIRELLTLQRAEDIATGRSLEQVEFCDQFLRDTPLEDLNPQPLIVGEDLIALGMKPGPEFKRLLDAVARRNSMDN